MVAVPAELPVTIPAVPTEATEELLLVHEPPVVVLLSVVVLPVHTVAVPVIVPADGVLVTVTICVAVLEPQAPETV